MASVHNQHKHTITKIPDKLWNEVVSVLPKEKPDNTVGRRPVVPYRKVMDGIVYVLRTGCQWKMLPREYGSGSTCHRRFQEWVKLNVFKRMWIGLLKEYDNKKGNQMELAIPWQHIHKVALRGGNDRK